MEDLQKFSKVLEGRMESLSTEEENRRSPYMLARLDECRYIITLLQNQLFNDHLK
jgi:hypothetical protein